MPDFWIALASLALVIWFYLARFHGRFWRADQRLPEAETGPVPQHAIVAVIPARNEADVIGEAVRSLLSQDYPGDLRVVLVDDRSEDGTAQAAADGAKMANAADRLTIVDGEPLTAGWSGKLWAVSQGVAKARQIAPDTEFLLLTDADIVHDPANLRRLVAKAEREHLDLVSLMVRLHCRSPAEKLLIPAFVYFFQQIYPFPLANRPESSVAAAAGGCMLVRRDAYERAGGVEAIRDRLIDDCALAERIKRNGNIWIGLTKTTRSIRPYDGLRDIWNMVARTAYTQLRYSQLRLLGTVIGLVVTYLVPPVIVLAALFGFTSVEAGMMAALAWVLMVVTYAPTLKLYDLPALTGFALPLVATLYAGMTMDSAWRHMRGDGGRWKGRTYPHANLS